MYLGKLLSFDRTHDVELKHRIDCAWKKFYKFEDELTGKNCTLNKRLQVFVSVVQPSVLYGCVSWVMTEQRKSSIRKLQRKMLRMIVGTRRRTEFDADGESVLENLVAWVRRATAEARE